MSFNLSERQINYLYDSWQLVNSDQDRIGKLFYERLFLLQPQMRVYFKTDNTSQISKFMSTLTLLITKLHSGRTVYNDIQHLAQRHASYGTRPEHYAIIGEVLLWALENSLKEKWNADTKSAWSVLYEKISESMIGWSDVQNDTPKVA
ncbi:hemoglobin [Cytophagales bacterium WSM2-2]|nr:hemoglobin [Cytophagales bacterium WSM2-2]